MKKISTIVALFIVIGLNAQDYVEFTESEVTYSQDFNTLESAEATKDILWSNGTIPMLGWYAATQMQSTNPVDVIVYSTGTATTMCAAAGIASLGETGGDSERALGSRIANATGDLAYGVKIKNSTKAPITSLQITYTGEQWTYANSCAHMLTFAYKVNGGIKDTEFTVVPELTFTSPITVEGTTTTNPINGNAAANRVVGITHTINVLIPAGEFIFLRWLDINDGGTGCSSGVDQGLAIDDLTVIATVQSGVHQTRDGNIKLYVNQDDLVIKADKVMKDIVVYNALGHQMHIQSIEAGETAITINHLSTGVYFAKLTLADGSASTIRFIK